MNKYQRIANASRPHPSGSTLAAEPEDADLELERALTSLIRAEASADPALSIRAARELGQTPTESRLSPRTKPHIPIRKLTNAAGMFFGAAVLGAVLVWFTRLPDEPSQAPWSLLGSQYADQEQTTEKTEEDAAPVHAGGHGITRPLGQFEFGPPLSELRFNAWATGSGDSSLIPPIEYHSIHELEAAFNASYLPPAECYNWTSTAQMAACGNHRIRARRAFIESNGRTSELSLSQGDPPAPTGDWREDWRRQQEWYEPRNEHGSGWQTNPHIEHRDLSAETHQDSQWHRGQVRQDHRDWETGQLRQPGPESQAEYDAGLRRNWLDREDLPRRPPLSAGSAMPQGHTWQHGREWPQEPSVSRNGNWRSGWDRVDRQHPSEDWRTEWLQQR